MAKKGAYLSPQQISTLRRSGVSQNEINQYLNGGASSSVKKKINTVLGGLTSPPAMASIGPTIAEAETYAREAAPKTVPKQPVAYNDWGAQAKRQADQGQYQPATRTSTPSKKVAPKSPVSNWAANQGPIPKAVPGAYGRTYDIPSEGFRGSVDPNTGQVRKPSGPTKVYPADSAGQSVYDDIFPTAPELDPYPTLPDYTVPTLEYRDFTDQARGVVDPIFAPIFDALNQSKTNIGAQGENSRKIVGGLYENMVKDIATQAQANSAQYDQSKQTATDQGAQLNQQIGQNYQGANQNTADLLSKLGIQAAAPELLQAGADQQAWQQGQAATNTNAMQNYYDQQKQGQASYDTSLGQITQNQGAVAQQDILAQVQNALAGVDQQVAQTESEKAKTALDMSTQLSDRDFQLQQANAGFQMQGLDRQRQAAIDAWQAANESKKWDYTTAGDLYDRQRQATLDQTQLDMDKLKLEGSQAGAGLQPDQTRGVVNAKVNLVANFGEQLGSQLFEVAQGLVAGVPDKNDPAAINKLYASAQQYAQQNGMKPDQVFTAALQVWNSVFGS